MKFKKHILTGLWILVLSLILTAPPVFAQDCKAEIAAVHKLMVDKSSTLPLSDLEKVEVLIIAAMGFCDAADESSALQKLTEAKAILGVS